MTKIIEKDINIECSGGQELSATVYQPSGEVKAAIFIGPATGIKKGFYHSFATYLAENGYGVITFDNSGIGGSLKGAISKSKVSLQSWGEIDMYFVLEELKKQFPEKSYHLIGHSAGGQLVGLMANAQEITSIFNYACSSGKTKNIGSAFRLKARFFMNIFIPINNLLLGYTKSSLVGMGESLPKKVAQQWRVWCNGGGYVEVAFGKTIKTHLYDALAMPSLWVNSTDDDIANTANVKDMLRVFTTLEAKTLTLDPKAYGLKEIGHMKFFSRRNKVLWELALDWFGKFE